MNRQTNLHNGDEEATHTQTKQNKQKSNRKQKSENQTTKQKQSKHCMSPHNSSSNDRMQKGNKEWDSITSGVGEDNSNLKTLFYKAYSLV